MPSLAVSNTNLNGNNKKMMKILVILIGGANIWYGMDMVYSDVWAKSQSSNLQLYGIFDGYDGEKVATYAAQRMPAEILLGQLEGEDVNDEKVQHVLKQAFHAVERGYMDSLAEVLACRANLIDELKDSSTYEASQKYPEKVQALNDISQKVSCGSSVILALIFNGKLYIASLGQSRALLCKGTQSQMTVVQIGPCHDISNEQEQQRLADLGLDGSAFTHFANYRLPTRCLGDFARKGGYKECFDLFKNATGEPVIAEPELSEPIVIDDQCLFLVLISSGTYYAMQDATQIETEVNPSIAGMVATELLQQSTLNAVAQAVVDRVGRLHHDRFINKPPDTPNSTEFLRLASRSDITLVARNFHFPFNQQQNNCQQLFLSPPMTMQQGQQAQGAMQVDSSDYMTNTTTSRTNDELFDTISSTMSEVISAPAYVLPLDKDGRIAPYVDFTDFYNKCEAVKKEATEKAGKNN